MSNNKKKNNSSKSPPSPRRPSAKTVRKIKEVVDKTPARWAADRALRRTMPSKFPTMMVSGIMDPVLCQLGDLLYLPQTPPEGTTILQDYNDSGGLFSTRLTTLKLTMLQPVSPGRVMEYPLFEVHGASDAEAARLALLVIQDLMPRKGDGKVTPSFIIPFVALREKIREALAALGYNPLIRTTMAIHGFGAMKADKKRRKA